MCCFFCHYVTSDGSVSHTKLHSVPLLSVARGDRGERCSKGHSTVLHVRGMTSQKGGLETSGRGEVLERLEKPILAEAHCVAARCSRNFLLEDFHTKSHKSFPVQFRFCIAAGGLTRKEDAADKLGGIYSGFALSLPGVSEHQRGRSLG